MDNTRKPISKKKAAYTYLNRKYEHGMVRIRITLNK